MATIDIALQYDPATRRCDVAFNGRDFAVDATPATPMLVALVCDRRARPDDPLPQDVTDFSQPETLVGRRGWPGDAFDPFGQLCGSRLWLLDDEKQTEAVRVRAEGYCAEALAPIEAARSVAIQLTVRWLRRGVLAIQAIAGRARVVLYRGVG